MQNPDFFLTSAIEGYPFKETRKCQIIKRLRSKNRNEWPVFIHVAGS